MLREILWANLDSVTYHIRYASKVSSKYLLTCAAYPTLRNPVPPSRTASIVALAQDCSENEGLQYTYGRLRHTCWNWLPPWISWYTTISSYDYLELVCLGVRDVGPEGIGPEESLFNLTLLSTSQTTYVFSIFSTSILKDCTVVCWPVACPDTALQLSRNIWP